MHASLILIGFLIGGRIGRGSDATDEQREQKRYPWLEQVQRQEVLTRQCSRMNTWANVPEKLAPRHLDHVLVDRKHKLLYCYVPKIACTNWKRIFMVLTGVAPGNLTNLMDIPGTLAHEDNSTLRLNQLDFKLARAYLEDFTTFIIARHPFERLLSAFRNKFENTYSQYFQLRYGRNIIKKYRPTATVEELETGRNVTFREFVLYLLEEGPTNEHWQPLYDLCHPCLINYSFIGRYETLIEDSRAVLDLVSAPPIAFPATRTSSTAEKLRTYFQQLSMSEIESLHRMYEMDFKLFGYDLEDMLGFDLA